MESESEKKNKRKGLIGTLVFHALLVLIFSIYGLSHSVPLPEQGISLNFGTSDVGSGEVQPDNFSELESPVDEEQSENVPEEVVAEVEEEVLTSEAETPIEIEEKKPTEKPVEKVEEVKEVEKPRELNPNLSKALNKAFTNNGGGGSEGDDDEKGDKGKIEGSKDGKSYTGGGSGNGLDYSLDGRGVVSVPKIEDKSQEQGKVVVDIVVDRNGNVISAKAGGRGSTTNATVLLTKAREAALKTKFTQNLSGPIEQRGAITFVFILE